MGREIALIVGVGQATGQSVCRALADRYKLLLIARSPEFITALADELPDAVAFACDVSDREAYSETLTRIRDSVGLPRRILVNTESAAWGAYNELSLEAMSTSFDVNVISVLQLVQTLFPNREDIPLDTRIMVSSSPAAYAPPAGFLGLAPSRVAQRVLAELLNENLAHSGLHFSVFSIDGVIDEPKMRAMFPDRPTSYFIQPDDIAREMVRGFNASVFEMAAGITGESSFSGR
jgi:NAD(P)-dependent dehydrogenase (short-subunit alcohol dehydrogenase family)